MLRTVMRAITYSKDAAKTLRRIPANVAATIRAKIAQYAASPEGLAGNVIQMAGSEGFLRLRVGDWRVVFTESGTIVAIVRIARAEASTSEDMTMNAQIITTPGGERMVIVPEADYLAMVEALETAGDIAAVNLFNARLKSGEEELLPSAMVDALVDGENPIRVWREHRGLSVKELAGSAAITPAYLSQIEAGKRAGTVETLRKIALALKITLDDLVG